MGHEATSSFVSIKQLHINVYQQRIQIIKANVGKCSLVCQLVRWYLNKHGGYMTE